MTCKSPDNQVAANVRAEMARRGVTQIPLARHAEMSQQALSRRLSGNVSFTVSELERIADFLEVSLSTLIDRAGTVAS